MSAIQYLIIKILLFNSIFVSNSIINFESKEGSALDSDLIPLNNDVYLNTNFESNFLRKIENAVDSILTNRINLLEKQIRDHNEGFIQEKIKSYMQTEIQTIKTHKYDAIDNKCSKNEFPESCFEIKECRNDVFSIIIKNVSNETFSVACDFETLNSGWTIIQRRQDGSENFFRNWNEYVKGFGNVNGEFFIGLEKLHALTSFGPQQELYIILEDFEGTRKYARYTNFKVGPESNDFKLTVDGYSGNAGNSLKYHNDKTFSTKDYGEAINCANSYKGGWWYNSCHRSNLNGLYLLGKYTKSKRGQGITWMDFRGNEYSLKFVQMMIRPKQIDD